MAPLRCLVAPQNTFIHKIERLSFTNDVGFFVTNARILDNPVVFVDQHFSKMSGFGRSELFQKSAMLNGMHGRLTSKESLEKWSRLLENNLPAEVELLLYKKSGEPGWFQLRMMPVRDERDSVLLNIIFVRDVTCSRRPIPEQNAGFSKLARFAFKRNKNNSSLKIKSKSENNFEADAKNIEGNQNNKEENNNIKKEKLNDNEEKHNSDTFHHGENEVHASNNIRTTSNNNVNSTVAMNSFGSFSKNCISEPELNNISNRRLEKNYSSNNNKIKIINKNNFKKSKSNKTQNNICADIYKRFGSNLLKRFSKNKVASTDLPVTSLTSFNNEENELTDSQTNIFRPESSRTGNKEDIKTRFLKFRRSFHEKYQFSKNDSTDHKSFIDSSLLEILYYKQEPPITPPHIILHYSLFKNVWDWLILFFTLITCVITPYTLSFNDRVPKNVALIVVETIIDIFFLIDTHLTFYVTFPGTSGQVVSDPHIIKKTYLTSWFLLDLLASLPYDIFALLAFSQTAFVVITIFSIARLLRTVRVGRHIYTYVDYGASVLVFLILLFVLIAHWFSCIWYLIGIADLQANIKYGWVWKLSKEVDAMFKHENTTGESNSTKLVLAKGPSDLLIYTTSLFYTLSSMTTIGFGNVSPTTEAEKIFTIFMMVFGSLLYATIFGNVTTIFQQMYSSTEKYHEMLSNVKDFMKHHQVPLGLTERVLDYVVATWTISKGIDTEKVLSYCPQDMRADVCIHLNRSIFLEQPAFRLASESCMRSLAIHFKLSHWAPGDILFHKGQSIESLCFVGSGTLEVTQDGEIVAFLGTGDSLGDLFWKENTLGQCMVDVKSLTYCNMHIIKREKLLEVLNFYTPFAYSFERNLKLSYNLRKRLVFRKLVDVLKEKELSNRTYTSTDSPNTDITVRKLFSKFRKSNTPDVESFLSRKRAEFSEKEVYSFDNEAFEENFKKPRSSFSDVIQDSTSEISSTKTYFNRSKEFSSNDTLKNNMKRNELKRLETIRSESYEERNTRSKTPSKKEEYQDLQEIQKSIHTLNFNIQIIMKKLDSLTPSSPFINNIVPPLSTQSPTDPIHSYTTETPLAKQISEESSNKSIKESKSEVKISEKQNLIDNKRASNNKKPTTKKFTKTPKSLLHTNDAHFMKSKNSKTLTKNILKKDKNLSKSLNIKESTSTLNSKALTDRTEPVISTDNSSFKKQNITPVNDNNTHDDDPDNIVDNNIKNKDLVENEVDRDKE